VDDLVLAADAPARFSDALGVHDPIHRDVDAARLAGLPAPIVPMGGVIAIVWDALLRRGAASLSSWRRLRVWPQHPIVGGDRLSVSAHGPDGDGVTLIRVRLSDLPDDGTGDGTGDGPARGRLCLIARAERA
jgi:acyl dehydratase